MQEGQINDGVRFTWQVWPQSKVEITKMVVPIAAVFTPLYPLAQPEYQVVPYEPVKCRSCGTVLNPFCQLDYYNKAFQCSVCLQRTQFPSAYAEISEEYKPVELHAEYSTVEYTIPQAPTLPPALLFVLDLCCTETELNSLREAIEQILTTLPEYVLIGVITFGSMVQIHELGCESALKQYIFPGDKTTDPGRVRSILNIAMASQGNGPAPQPGQRTQNAPLVSTGIGRFFMKLEECEYTLSSLLSELKPEPQVRQTGHRYARGTGAAVSAATALLESCCPGSPGRLMLFTSGPGTLPPGKVVDTDLCQTLRMHQELEKGMAKYYQESVEYYVKIGERLAEQGHAIDVFACALDQVGVAEMRYAIEPTGGVVVMAEEYIHDVFRETMQRMLAKDAQGLLPLASQGQLEVKCSRELKIAGAIGPLVSGDRPTPQVYDTPTGVGGTVMWRFPTLTQSTAATVFFEVTQQDSQQQTGPCCVQFQTSYRHPDGSTRLRVTTTARHWASSSPDPLDQSFDQEVAAVVIARTAIWKSRVDEMFDTVRWLDRILIRLCQKFGSFMEHRPETFQLPPHFSFFPQFIYNLRRSQFIQVFNNSPDETAYFRLMLNRAEVEDALLMIQPMLKSYPLDNPPHPVMLDVAAVQPDCTLLLDSWFTVVVHYGSTIEQWRIEGYHNKPEFENVAFIVNQPVEDAKTLVQGRVPLPRIVITQQGGSQARFLLHKVNPSATYRSPEMMGYGGGGDEQGAIIMTDDVSFQTFQEHLARLVVGN